MSPQGREALRHYTYRGSDHSLLYKYWGTHWAQYLVDNFTPEWVACVFLPVMIVI